MEPIQAFFLGLGLLFALALATLLCVQRPLNQILVEICGAEHRARFWTRFFSAALLLSVLFFSLWSPPDESTTRFALREIVGMLRGGLFGMLVALAALALIMMVWQSRFERGQTPPRSGNSSTS